MKSYVIMEDGNGVRRAVKQGWAWPGLFFSWIWGFYRGQSVEATVGLVISVVAGVVFIPGFTFGLWWLNFTRSYTVTGEVYRELPQLVWLGVALYFAAFGNRARLRGLSRKGFRPNGVMPARSEADALRMIVVHRDGLP